MNDGFRIPCLLAWGIVLAIALTGCGTTPSEAGGSGAAAKPAATEAAGGDLFAPYPEVKTAGVQEGLSVINGELKAFKQAVESEDRETAEQAVARIIGVWKSIGPQVQIVDAQQHQRMEEDLSTFLSELNKGYDTANLIDLSYRLYQNFRDAKEQLAGEAVTTP